MSYVAFQAEDGTVARLRGAERAYAGLLCNRLTLGVLYTTLHDTRGQGIPILKLLEKGNYLHWVTEEELPGAFASWFVAGLYSILKIREHKVSTWELALNTALALGNDVIGLLARLHGQCELHGYVEGHNREWLACVVQEGLNEHILREDMGWGAVITLLRKSASSPIVTSYSATESFPDMGYACWPEEQYDQWYDLSYDEQWSLALEGLRDRPGGLEWDRTTWPTFYFGSGFTAFDILEHLTGE